MLYEVDSLFSRTKSSVLVSDNGCEILVLIIEYFRRLSNQVLLAGQ